MNRNYSNGLARALAVAALIVLTGMGGWIADWRGANLDAAMRQQLLRQAVAIANTIKPETVKALTFTAADQGNPVFEHLRQHLIAYGRIIPQRGIYSMVLRDGVIRFGPESYADDDPMRSLPGQAYEEPGPSDFEIFQTGKPTTLGPRRDEYGTFVSASAPVLDRHNGEVLMVVGLDIEAADWQARINRVRLESMLVTLILLLIVLAGVFAIRWRNRLPDARKEQFKHLETVWVGVLGLTLTGAAAGLVLEADRREQWQAFDHKADDQANAISAMFSHIRHDAATLTRYLQGGSSIDSQQFRAIAAPMASMIPMQTYAWIPAIPAAQQAAVETAAQREGLSDFAVWERNAREERVPAAGRSYYYPVYAIEPLAGNAGLLGFDLGSEPPLRTVLEQAARSGLVTATDPARRFNEPGSMLELWTINPVFAHDAPDRPLRGFALGIVHPQAILDGALRRHAHENGLITLDVLDLKPDSVPVRLATYPPKSADDPAVAQPSSFQQIAPLFIFGRTLALVSQPSPLFYARYSPWMAWLAGLTGLLLTTVFTAFVGLVRTRRATLEQLVLERTAALRQVETRYSELVQRIPVGVYVFRIAADGAMSFEYVSPRFCQIVGVDADAVLRDVNVAFAPTHPDELENHLRANQHAAATLQPFHWEGRFIIRGETRWLQIESDATPLPGGGSLWNGVVSDITERKQTDRQLRVLSRAVEQSPVTIVITDLTGAIEYVNPKFTETTGYTVQEALGNNPRVLKSGQQPKQFYQKLWQTISEGHDWHGEFSNRKKNGEIYWESASISPIRDSEGHIVRFVAIKEDITKRKHAEAVLLQAKQAVEAANVAKSQFLANITHEIRTPMNGVIGMTGLLLDTSLSEAQRRYADIIRSSGENLLSLINDILDFSKMEADQLELDLIDFDLCAMLQDTAEILAPRAHEKNLEFICHIAPELHCFLHGDPGRLRQILLHLCGNAIKFTTRGEVAIDVVTLSERDQQLTVLFEVRDTGIGIPKEKISLLFNAFQQLDASTTRQFGGAGLGLVIAKRLAEKMGGEIGVRSVEGQGSTFWFTVNLNRQPPDERSMIVPFCNLHGIRVLAVDDKVTNRLVVAEQLASCGLRHEETESAALALLLLREAHAANDPFRLVVTDMQMSDMDGEGLGRAIKADPDLCNTILVMMTSLGNRGDAKRLANIGFAAYLTKPVNQAQLHDCLMTALSNAASGQVPRAGLITRHTLSEAQRRPFRILLAEDNPINQRIVLKILEKLGYPADAVANGKEAIQALEARPYDLVFMDVEMPEMDGLTATRRIRAGQTQAPDPNLPIIAMTGHTEASDRDRCLDAGMNDHLGKPVQPQMMAEIVTRWSPAHRIEAVQITAPKPRTATVSAHGLPDISGLNTSLGLRRLDGDRALYYQLLGRFVETQSGAAPALHQALVENDLDLAKRIAHNIKGVTGNLGATGVEIAAERLGKALHQRGQEPLTEIAPLLADFERQMSDLIRRLREQISPKPDSAPLASVQMANYSTPLAELRIALDDLIPHLKTRKPKKCAEAVQAIQLLSWPADLQEAVRQLVQRIRQYQFSEALALTESLRQKFPPGDTHD